MWPTVDTGAQPLMSSELVFCPLPWFIYKISGLFLYQEFHHCETLNTSSLPDLEQINCKNADKDKDGNKNLL